MKYEVFRNRDSSDDDFNFISDLYKRIMSEDKYLCANTQHNINTGVFVNGEMHPKKEKGPLYFQKLVRGCLAEHHEQEDELGEEIWPSRQALPRSAVVSEKDVAFCSAVECGKVNKIAIEV